MNLLLILFVFFVINGETKRKISLPRKGGGKRVALWYLMEKFSFEFPRKTFSAKDISGIFNLVQQSVHKGSRDNGRVPQWKCFSFYHLIQQCFWTVQELSSKTATSREKIQFSVKSECEAIKRQCSPLGGSDDSRIRRTATNLFSSDSR